MKRSLILFLSLVSTFFGHAQTNVDYTTKRIGDNTSQRSGLDLSPDGKYLAIAGTQKKPLIIYDWENDQIIKQVDAGQWPGGGRVHYSKNGNYLLLQNTPFNDMNINKDKPIDFEIVDVKTGAVVQKINQANAAKISASETKYLVLKNKKVTIYNLKTGAEINSIDLPSITNSVALSPDESILAISHKPTLEQVKNAPTIRGDKKAKKAIKPALKYREVITLYDAKNLTEITSINELYDVVYRLQFSKNGNKLFVHTWPHTKMQTSTAGRQGYVNVIDVINKQPSRVSYLTLAPFEPDFMENEAGTVFGIVSLDKFPEVRLYDAQNGRLLEIFNLEQRLGEVWRTKLMGDGRASFTFLPNNSVFIVTGNQAVIWKPEALQN